MGYKFIDKNGTFRMENAQANRYLYLPLASPAGVMNSITPEGHGDSKLSQDEFLMEPVSCENLHESTGSRNFWCRIKGYPAWSALGNSALQLAGRFTEQEEGCQLTAGQLWQETKRTWKQTGLTAIVKNFCPVTEEKAEIMMVTLENNGTNPLTITPTAAIPIFARGADHIRDHRHVTSLLNRIQVTDDGVTVTPAMSFDERGHHPNFRSYGVYGRGEDGTRMEGAFPVLEEFTGEEGSLICPEAVAVEGKKSPSLPGTFTEGYEAMGALKFPERILAPEEKYTYIILLSYDSEGMKYLDMQEADKAFEEMRSYWENQKNVTVSTGNPAFDGWMQWVGIQPFLRRIYGCSFLPHHDYGRGGRGWRDLWQDCLALILMNPEGVRQDLLGFFAGIRTDGTNATIIGNKPGEFKADRNNIVRVWMDHGYWPFFTVKLYLDQTGDYDFLLEKTGYFKDQITHRGEETDASYSRAQGTLLKNKDNTCYQGTVLEHLLIQQLAQFFDVGKHRHMRLRGADWNDALDMAPNQGESVAFTAAYSGSMKGLCDLLAVLKQKGTDTVNLPKELRTLLYTDSSVCDSAEKMQETLHQYCDQCESGFSGGRMEIPTEELKEIISSMYQWIQKHIRRTEFLDDQQDGGWFNGYYDDHGNPVEGIRNGQVRMMLTSQVFTILSGTATDDQTTRITRSADRYLYEKRMGGYRLNTNFQEVKLDLGRMFGFAYGHKENGAVFCHMAVMYAYALYERGFVREGHKVLDSLFSQCMNFETSRIYPGIPEYFNEKGRGMYSYLTGAASWLVLTMLTKVYGVRGECGDLCLCPQLLASQFDVNGESGITCSFAGRKLEILYVNRNKKEIGDYEAAEISINGKPYQSKIKKGRIERAAIQAEPENQPVQIKVILN